MVQRLSGSNPADATKALNLTDKKPSADIREMSHESKKKLNNMLVKAVRDGNADKVKRLLKAGASVYAKVPEELFKYGWTVMMDAASEGKTEICKMLIDKGHAVDATNDSENTALYIAAEKGKTETCRYLIEEHADVNFRGSCGFTPLIQAADEGHAKTCALLIDNGANINDAITEGNSKGWTALMKAATHGKTRACAVLVFRGADTKITDPKGRTALKLAEDYEFHHKKKTAAFLRSYESLQKIFDKKELKRLTDYLSECAQ